MIGSNIVFRTPDPPRHIYQTRALARAIAEDQQKNPQKCYLHLKEWQHYRGLSMREAAADIGVCWETYRNWHDGRNWPVSEWLPQIARTFGCSIEELFFPPPGMREEK